MTVKDLIRQAKRFRASNEVRTYPAVKDGDGEIVIEDGISKPILGIRLWKGEVVILYEED